MFHLIAADAPLLEVPPEYGSAGTVALHFRRLTGAGLWKRLLQALADLGPRHSLQALRRVIFRAARRAYRIRSLGIIVLARRLGFSGALVGPSWLLPDPDLSKTIIRLQLRHAKNFAPPVDRLSKALRNLMGMAGGRVRLLRYIRQLQP